MKELKLTLELTLEDVYDLEYVLSEYYNETLEIVKNKELLKDFDNIKNIIDKLREVI